MALISVDDIVAIIGDTTIDSDDETILQFYIDFAQGELEAWLCRPITVETFTTVAVSDADGRVYLPNTPIVSVTSVTIETILQDTDYYTITPWGLEMGFSSYASSLTSESAYLYDWKEPEITVVYTAGLDAPQAINSAIVGVVIRQWNERKAGLAKDASSALGIKEMRVEDYSIEYDAGGTNDYSAYSSGATPIIMFRSDADFNSVKRFKRRSIA